MATTVDALGIRGRLGRDQWAPPVTFGPDGWRFDNKDTIGQVIVSCSDGLDPDQPAVEWLHASISWSERMPDYLDLVLLHRAVWPHGHAIQAFVPEDEHVNFAEHALHLWGRRDGRPFWPNFGRFGMI